MDTQSALQIINSSNVIKVLYQGAPVWLQGINGNVARVRFMENGSEGEVPVHDLVKVDQ